MTIDMRDSIVVELVAEDKFFTSDLRKSTRELKKFESRIEDVGKKSKVSLGDLSNYATGISSVMNIAKSAARALGALASSMGDVIQRGGAFSAVASRFESFAGPETLQNLLELTNNQIGAQQAMQSFTQVMEVGNVSRQEYTEWLERTTNIAQARGGQVSEWIDRMTEALSGGGIEAWRGLGVNVQQVNDVLRQAGVSAESVTGRALAQTEAMRQLREAQGEVSNESANLADAYNALVNQAEDYADEQARIIVETPQLTRGMDQLRREIFGVGGAAEQTGGQFGQMATQVAAAIAGIVQSLFLGMRDMMQSMADTADSLLQNETIRNLLNELGLRENVSHFAGVTAFMADNLRQAAEAAGRVQSALGGRVISRQDADDQRRGLTPGRPPPTQSTDQIEKEISLEAIQETNRELSAAKEQERFVEFMRMEAEGALAQKQHTIAQLELEREAHEERVERANELDEMAKRAREEAEAFRVEQQQQQLAAAQNAAGVFSTISGFIGRAGALRQERHKAHIEQLKEQNASAASIKKAEKAAEKSAEKVARAQGIFLVAYNSVMAATEVARAIGSYPDVAGIIAHSAAAAAHVAAAVMAGAQLKGGSASSPSNAGAAASTFVPAEQDVPTPETGQGGPTTIVNEYSLSKTSADLGETLVEADWRRAQDGRPDIRPNNIAYEAL